MIVELLTGVSIGATFVVFSGMVLSVLTRYRFWPPGERDWRWATYFGASVVAFGGLLAVSYLDWNTFVFPQPVSFIVGTVSIGVGMSGFAGGVLDLGIEESEGLEGDLRTGGFYRYTRNPQIVFTLVALSGAPLLANSLRVTAIVLVLAAWFVLMPFAEEPWLHWEYGEAYQEYRETVPRFIGSTTVRRLLNDWRLGTVDET